MDLPRLHRLAQVEAFYVRAGGGFIKGMLGGQTQHMARLGDRMGVTVTHPAMDEQRAKAWIAARLKQEAEGDTLVLRWPQPDYRPAVTTAGAKVNGGSQTGTSLAVDGLVTNTVLRGGRAVSFQANSRHYLHQLTEDVTVSGGAATLSISPMLRASPANDADLEIVTPKIEGFIEDAPAWTMRDLRVFGLSFTLVENR